MNSPCPEKENPHERFYELTDIARQLASFHERYHLFFKRHTVSLSDKAFQYLKGLFQAEKKHGTYGGKGSGC
jgi:hypothetical protein